MAREGTRSQTGNSRPRVFHQVDTAPTIKRLIKPKAAPEKPTVAVAAAPSAKKPVGVTKKNAPGRKPAASKKTPVAKIYKSKEAKAKAKEARSKPAHTNAATTGGSS